MPGGRSSRFRIIGVLVFIAAYIASIVVYVDGGMGHPHVIATEGLPAADGTTVTVDVEAIQSDNSVLRANITVTPGPALLDPATHGLKDDLSLTVTSLVNASKHSWPKGGLPDVFSVSGTLTGDVADWPLDHYRSGPIDIELLSGAAQVPVPASVILVDRLLGWQIDVTHDVNAGPHGSYQLNLGRTLSTVGFGVVILGVLIALSVLGLFVATQTLRDRRKFQPPMTTWYAAMLFAVMPLRNALPDSPPFGAWIDITVVLWVIVVLVISMTIYITCWWRHLNPDRPAI
jgi:Domain of unknown function (DUF4436)